MKTSITIKYIVRRDRLAKRKSDISLFQTHNISSMSMSPAIIASDAMRESMIRFTHEAISRLSDKYGFDKEEAIEFLKLSDESVLPFPAPDEVSSKVNKQQTDLIKSLVAVSQDTTQPANSSESEQDSPKVVKRRSKQSDAEKQEKRMMREAEREQKKVAKQVEKQAIKVDRQARKALGKTDKQMDKLLKKLEKAGKSPKKRGPSAYNVFCKSERAVVKQENPEMSAKDIMSELGKRWKALSDEEKAVYNAENAENKRKEELENLVENM